VRKLIKFDPEVKNVSKEAVVCMTKLSELFLSHLGRKSQAAASIRGGKTITLEDLLQAIHSHSDFDCLAADFPRKAGKLSNANANITSQTANNTKSRKDVVKPASSESFFLPRTAGSKHPRMDEEIDDTNTNNDIQLSEAI
jgi:hypothetical protein